MSGTGLDIEQVSSYKYLMSRRKPGTLLPLELDILAVAVELQRVEGHGECYGYSLARALADGKDAKRMVAHGTLYKALSRLTIAGLLGSQWEDADIAEAEARPRRRLYWVSPAGAQAWSDARMAAAEAHSEAPTASGAAALGPATA